MTAPTPTRSDTGAERVYLDHNATTPLCTQAHAAMADAMALGPANPSSVHGEGRRARAIIDTAREQVAALVGGRATNVVFTSGATEAGNWLLSAPWDVVFLSGIEHPCVTAPAQASNAALVELPTTSDGVVDINAAAELMADRAARQPYARMAILAQAANNETGVIQPVAKLAEAARAHGIRVICDAVQAIGKVPVDISELGADALFVSAHKFGGPAGVGAVVFGCDLAVPPLVSGGGQERGRRCGTENVVGIAGFGAAAAVQTDALEKMTELAGWRARIETHIEECNRDGFVIAKNAPRLANTTFFANVGHPAETAVIKLDLSGVAVSSGSACSSGKTAQSTVLRAMGLPSDAASSAVRVSLGRTTQEADIEKFCAVWSRLFGAQRGRETQAPTSSADHNRQVA